MDIATYDEVVSPAGDKARVDYPAHFPSDLYAIRRSSLTTLSLTAADGNVLFSKKIAGWLKMGGISSDGAVFAVIDSGFDPQEVRSRSWRYSKSDPRLIGHRIMVFNRKGDIVLDLFFDSGAPAHSLRFSKSGEWMIFSHASAITRLVNLKTKKVETFESEIAGWDVSDSGELTVWREDEPSGKWVKANGRDIWEPKQKMRQRLFRRRPGATEVERLEKTRIYDAP